MAQHQPIPVVAAWSYARRTGEAVRLVAHLAQAPAWAAGPVRLRLSSRERRPVVVEAVASTADGRHGVAVEATVPARRLRGAVWRMALAPDVAGTQDTAAEDPARPLEARLVVHPGLPVALVSGPRPATRMPAPAPRRQAALAAEGLGSGVAALVRGGGGAGRRLARGVAGRLPEPLAARLAGRSGAGRSAPSPSGAGHPG